MPFDLEAIRERFPGLSRPAIFFDNPAGTQVAQSSLDRITDYLVNTNANHGGEFATSRESDLVVSQARQATADFLNASRPEEIIFGPNMTTLTFHLSRSIAKTLEPGDTIVVTRLDHDANITPWTLIAADLGCNVVWVDFDVEDGTLQMESYNEALAQKPKLVALGYASNALGTINPVKKMTQMAHQAGALVYIDAVQYAPHGPIDLKDLDVDFLACSAYKFFGPHIGILYGRYGLLDKMMAYKVRPASNELPWKYETGTPSFEGIAGVLGALEHLEWIGTEFGGEFKKRFEANFEGRGRHLKQGMAAIQAYEYGLSHKLLETLQQIPGLRIYGLDDLQRMEERVPTVAVNLEGNHPRQVAKLLDERNIYVWNGNFYALSVTERLGVEDSGGVVRIGGAHYNTYDEIDRLGEALEEISRL
ncbi:MAG: cysteine desulfurase-like protein [Anaerolineales bacterium]|nr:cysteine desulfurase-like protein [Anaerolineales bacterium]